MRAEPLRFTREGDTFHAAFAGADGEQATLRIDGIATASVVRLNGEELLRSDSMHARHELPVTLRADNALELECLPLDLEPRKPRARWRTAVADNALRFHRTSLLGRAPGFAPEPLTVGPYRGAWIVRGPAPRWTVRPDADGTVEVSCDVPAEVELDGVRTPVPGTVRVESPTLWWPHTHGTPHLYQCRLLVDGEHVDTKRVGFRSLSPSLPLRVNDVDVFARGAVWTHVDGDLREALEQVVACGLNMLRVVGLGAYESDAFHDLCDELGILVWQDFMFTNFDYPFSDDAFRRAVEDEVRAELHALGGRPSLAVLCGGSEVEQQVAMLGLDPQLARDEVLEPLVREAQVDAVWVANSPTGGDLPFYPRDGVANYFGVGGYRRPLEDARRADVRFAGECLAFANVPNDDAEADVFVPQDNGSSWTFADVRDHYVRVLHDVDPAALERERYLELGRATTGEVMAEVLGEWRRSASTCGGGLILWLRDLVPGSGWGIVQADGAPKVCWHHVRRAMAPVAVWTSDEGMNGIDLHVANDTADPVEATLHLALYAAAGNVVAEAEEAVALPPHGGLVRSAEGLLGRFVDVGYAYRFGPPQHEAVVATLRRGDELLSQSFRFPAGRPERRDVGLTAEVEGDLVRLHTEQLAYGVRIRVAGRLPEDDGFSLAPGAERTVRLAGAGPVAGTVTALNHDLAVRLAPPA